MDVDGATEVGDLLPGSAAESTVASPRERTDRGSAGGLVKGDLVGRFIVVRKLGEGGMGVVLSAYDPNLERKVAIKVLRRRDLGGAGTAGRERLIREARAMAKLRHDNVVTVFEAGEHDGGVFIAMDYIDGGTLSAWLADRGFDGPPPTADDVRATLAMFIAAGRGLAAAHAVGMVHRDFKPDNVLIDDGDRPLVTDFGLAGLYEPVEVDLSVDEVLPGVRPSLGMTLTRTGDIMGTPRYMAPEQHEGTATDARTDQFAFCAALYRALFGTAPFEGDDYESLRASVIEGEVREPVDRGAVPATVRDAVMRGLSRRPDERFASMDELLEQLEWTPRSRMPWVIGGAVVVVSAVVAISIAIGMRRDTDAEGESRRVAERAAEACDCALITALVPEGARVTAVRPIPSGQGPRPWGPGTELLDTRQPTGQLAIPRGQHVIEYELDGDSYLYGVFSDGFGGDRAVTLPAPMTMLGYAFVPGGDVPVGDMMGTGDEVERPAATVHLDPYLIRRVEVGDELVSFDDAVSQVRSAGGRLATSAEWEWAARLGVAEGMLENAWEWTSSEFAPYPYVHAPGRVAGAGDTIEIRGGQRSGCRGGVGSGDRPVCQGDPSDVPRPSRRYEGRRDGAAQVRPVAIVDADASLSVELRLQTHTERDGPKTYRTRQELHPGDTMLVERFVAQWEQLDGGPAIIIETSDGFDCAMSTVFVTRGIPRERIAFAAVDGGRSGQFVVRLHPNQDYRAPGAGHRCIMADTVVEIMDTICFDGVEMRASSDAILDNMAATLAGNEDIRLVEVQGHVAASIAGDKQHIAATRARIVRAALIARGIESDRLVAVGYADRQPIGALVANRDNDDETAELAGLEAFEPAPATLGSAGHGGCNPERPDDRDDRIELLILERAPKPATPGSE